MYAPAPPPNTMRATSDSNILATTKQRIQRQLTAVIRLSEHNAAYLEPFERAWIEYIIGEALSLSCDVQTPLDPNHPHLMKMTTAVSGLRETTSTYGLVPRPWSPAHMTSENEMNILLATSKSLNSANSLLSCCYDRWSWLQCSRPKQNHSQTETDNPQELLGRRKQWQRRQSIATSSNPDYALPRRYDTTSSGSSRVATTSIDGSENSMSLIADDTIERWRQNAEDSLKETTARLEAGGMSPRQSPTSPYRGNRLTTRSGLTDHKSPMLMTDTTAATVNSCAIQPVFAQPLSMSLSRPSTNHGEYMYTGATEAAHESYSQDDNPPFYRFEVSRAFEPSFRSMLYNSFDKEAVNCTPQRNNKFESGPSLTTASIYASSHLHPRLPTIPQASPVSLQSTLVSNNLKPDLGHRPTGSSGSVMYSLPTALSTVSVQSRVSEDSQVPRSRGRRWLEEQSDRADGAT